MSQKPKFKVRKGDQVIILAGKHKGDSGKINRIDSKKLRVYVEGLNIAKKHQKANAQGQGGIVDKAMSIHISNVAFQDPTKKQPSRIGYKVENGNKTRVAKKSNSLI